MTNDQGPRFLAFGLWSSVFGLWSVSIFAQMPGNVEDIRDIRGPVDYPGSWVPWAVCAAVLVFGALGVFLWRRFYCPKEFVMNEPEIPAWEVARTALAELREENYPSRNLVKPYYSELSDILRRYIEHRFQIDAPEMTTEEFLESLRFSTSLNETQKRQLQKFLTSCDMVKFAKHDSSMEEMERSFELVGKFVEETIVQDTRHLTLDTGKS